MTTVATQATPTTQSHTSTASVSHATKTNNRPVLWRAALGYGVLAAMATAAVAAIADAAGHAPGIEGEAIPPAGFAQLTFIGALLGLALAAGLRRWSARPHHRFVVTTIVLTAMSCVPDLVVDTTVTSRVILITTHLVAAAIVVPAIARRLPDHGSR